MHQVLVVDDSRIMRNIVKNTFTELKLPCEFYEAANGIEALKILQEQKITIVFLDWNMPQMNGMDFLKKVREKETYASLPIIMVTSEASKYSVVDAMYAGATDYIVKPVNPKIFYNKMQKILF